MYALTDASGCYASMEKIFDPAIRNRPVAVLTNNDGCICALCPIAKSLGIPKFEPYFKVKALLKKHSVVVRSSNYELYAYVSEQMMQVISRFSDNTYQYSIDEAFSYFNQYQNIINDWYQYGHQLRRAVWQESRMPVGVGFGSTLTLAKAANFAAKKLPDADGVAVINSEEIRQHILSQMQLSDVWGVASKLSRQLNMLGLKTAWDLACQSPTKIKQQFNITLARTVHELNGIKCLAWDDVKAPKKEIFSTRTLGQRITNKTDLRQALTHHALTVCRHANHQGSLIKKLYIFAANSPYDEKFLKRTIIWQFPLATDSPCKISAAIEHAVNKLFINGVAYYRSGVGAIELQHTTCVQKDLFIPNEPNIMQCYQSINQRFGKGSLQLATELQQQKFSIRRDFLSPCYTTRWSDIPKIRC